MYQLCAAKGRREVCKLYRFVNEFSEATAKWRIEVKSWRADLIWPVLTFVLAARPSVWDLHTGVCVFAWVCRSAEVVIVNRKCL